MGQPKPEDGICYRVTRQILLNSNMHKRLNAEAQMQTQGGPVVNAEVVLKTTDFLDAPEDLKKARPHLAYPTGKALLDNWLAAGLLEEVRVVNKPVVETVKPAKKEKDKDEASR